MRIDCERCPDRVGDTPCADCLVEFVLSLEDGSVLVEAGEAQPDGAAVLDAAGARAVRALSEAGLVPPVRLVPRRRAG
ncbi:MAG TPA: hypothetical protein VGB51_11080, partial [Actinomycetota bacterium]